ncbi:protein-tyrosine phosphatase [Pantoea agglomerans]|jgi:protein-tyrosine phosphatase|uniref:arsenate reductase/protein-tyrosine-phosphatase family protein n=1 Tax=Enterobacter agglomerans TaxID=549 RepID=UPI0013BA3C6A|nr:protein tyrosine phosphatase [Pantoea agglomerans]MDQ0431038.1 protein-tyrosine phosphatase [Pantoea agglomerans]NEG84755.1 protein tyrosine phosphatase [Pantoea agglomerans]NEH06896.1 protein tyrosine phosphatase [Pantoea agglomerans]
MFDSILVVCIGNICRSPTGERLLRRAFPDKKIDSAGICALIGKEADATAAEVAASHGISLEGHRGQKFTSELARQYDLILVMETSHLEQIKRGYPEVTGKAMLFGHWQDQLEIADPYKKSREMFELVYKQLAQNALHWKLVLNRNSPV